MKFVLITALITTSMLGGCSQENTVDQSQASVQEQKQTEVKDISTETTIEDTSSAEGEVGSELYKYIDESKVDSEWAMDIIRTLSSEEFGGRQAGSKEGTLAEDYVAGLFKEIGLESPDFIDGYKQVYPQKVIYPVQPSELAIVGGETFEYQIDFSERSMVGRTYYDADVSAQVLLINSKEELNQDPSMFDGKIILTSDDTFYKDKRGFLDQVEAIQENGVEVEGVLVSMEAWGPAGMIVSRGLKGDQSVNFDEEDPFLMHVSYDTYDKLSMAAQDGSEVSVKLDYELKDAEPANIVGVIPGKNESGDNETLIIGAHMDHVGSNLNGTYNPGALDNASGVATILEIARVAMQAEQPENTIVFVAFNGEEDGLLGSEYFVENPPVKYNEEATKMLNFDMVGSKKDLPIVLGISEDHCYSLRMEILPIAQELEMEYEAPYFGSSDHSSFAEHGIPSVLFIQEDYDYIHTSEDTIENTISEESLEEVIKLALAYIDKAAYQNEVN